MREGACISLNLGFEYFKRFHLKGDRRSVFAFDKVDGKARRQVIEDIQEMTLFEGLQADLGERIEEIMHDVVSFSDFDVMTKRDLDDLSILIASGLNINGEWSRERTVDPKIIRKMTWALWENTTPFPFWTSDRPIVLHGSIQNLDKIQTSNSIVYFPLNPRLCVALYGRNYDLNIIGKSRNRNLYRVLDDQESFVKHQNGLQLERCDRHIFSNIEDFRFAKKLMNRLPS